MSIQHQQYDHHAFPGVVPRTFIGPIFISLVSSPVYLVFEIIGFNVYNKFVSQYVVRTVMAICVLLSFNSLKKTIEKEFGTNVSKWWCLITVSQFHFMFYLSRPLPNTMVLPLVLLAFNSWLKKEHSTLAWLSAASVIIFRFELSILLGVMLLLDVYFNRISFLRLLKIGGFASLICLTFSVIIDSIMWRRITWPEGEVLWFNTILNKSSNYGTSPFLWYWYSAIPRALGASIFFIPPGIFMERRIRCIIVPPLVFIAMLSFLPHKELRFILYTFPLLNIAASCGCHKLWINSQKSFFCFLLCLVAVSHILINVLISSVLLSVAKDNYPGGNAISRLHSLVPKSSNAHIYIDNLAAQTGVSRFTQLHDNWIYNKTEGMDFESTDVLIFSHLLLEAKSKYSKNLKPFSNTHSVMEVIDGFSHIIFNYNAFPPLKIKTKPMIFLLKRNFELEASTSRTEDNAKLPLKIEIEDNGVLNAANKLVSGPEDDMKSLKKKKITKNLTVKKVHSKQLSDDPDKVSTETREIPFNKLLQDSYLEENINIDEVDSLDESNKNVKENLIENVVNKNVIDTDAVLLNVTLNNITNKRNIRKVDAKLKEKLDISLVDSIDINDKMGQKNETPTKQAPVPKNKKQDNPSNVHISQSKVKAENINLGKGRAIEQVVEGTENTLNKSSLHHEKPVKELENVSIKKISKNDIGYLEEVIQSNLSNASQHLLHTSKSKKKKEKQKQNIEHNLKSEYKKSEEAKSGEKKSVPVVLDSIKSDFSDLELATNSTEINNKTSEAGGIKLKEKLIHHNVGKINKDTTVIYTSKSKVAKHVSNLNKKTNQKQNSVSEKRPGDEAVVLEPIVA